MPVNEEKIRLAYELFLDRTPTPEEVSHHFVKNQLLTDLVFNFLESPEFRLKNPTGPSRRKSASLPHGLGKRTLIHIHIPKTAGTSLTAILAAGFPHDTHLPVGSGYFDSPDDLKKEDLKDVRFMFGHIEHGVARHFDQDHLYICTLRSPGTRLLSYYNYVRRTESHHHHKVVAGRDMSFGAFLKWASKRGNPFRYEVDNGQVRLLAGQNRQDKGALNADVLHTAISNLLSQDLIYGLTEHFEDFVRKLVKKGIITANINLHRNVSPDTAHFEQEVRNLTRSQKKIYDEFTYWDNIMYDIAKKSYVSTHT